MAESFVTTGKTVSEIDVRIGYRIIQLFSEGLYSSPTKAIEELVANSFDAGAHNVHVLLPEDPASRDAVIAVVDDGVSMDGEGLRRHWLIGTSDKRTLVSSQNRRKQIGKFGIGKLASYVLASKLTHVCKKSGHYFAVTMDYSRIEETQAVEVADTQTFRLPLRELTENEARQALPSVVFGFKEGHAAIGLFGGSASGSWTVAILSGLKRIVKTMPGGRLSWVLRTAMPLGTDFSLFLDGDKVEPSKMDWSPLRTWTLGKDMPTGSMEISSPAPADTKPYADPNTTPEDRYGLDDPALGRITGHVEVYDQSLASGKSGDIGRSHGFFVYIRRRLVNIDDPYFGISANALRHGTFSRFRMTVDIDSLDDDLSSTRESVKDAEGSQRARKILQGVFNSVRNWLDEYEGELEQGKRAATRIRESPGSLTRRPVLSVLRSAAKGEISPRLLAYPKNVKAADVEALINPIQVRAQSQDGLVVKIESTSLPLGSGIARFDPQTGVLTRNAVHPFVASYLEDLVKPDVIALICMAEVLTEAYLYELGLPDDQVHKVMDQRDELLRSFAASGLRRTAQMIALSLEEASTDKRRLEVALVDAFNSLGYEATLLGGPGKPDGVARARLAAVGSEERRYLVCLEAKSKEREGDVVSAKSVGISGIARHVNDYGCNHAAAVGPEFPTSMGEESAVVKEARDYKAKNRESGNTITLIRIRDLARLVRLSAVRPTGLDRLRRLFQECVTPQDADDWVERLAREPRPPRPPYEKILRQIWKRQDKRFDEPVEFSAVMTGLEYDDKLKMPKEELVETCRVLQRLDPEHISIRDQTIELTLPPETVLETALRNLSQLPQAEQDLSTLNTEHAHQGAAKDGG